MDIQLHDTGRRFDQEWIFRGVTARFAAGGRYAVLGPNGSGKSTLLKVLSGYLTPSEGRVDFSLAGRAIATEDIFRHLALAAPYVELVEELTLAEHVKFHQRHKPFVGGMDAGALIDRMGLAKAKNKLIRHFSSGMKQRAKLALACFSDTPLLLLDEPTTNLDQAGVAWYEQTVADTCQERLVVVCSNVEREYRFCDQRIQIMDYKP